MNMQAIGQKVSSEEHFVILLGSLRSDYDPIVKLLRTKARHDAYAKEILRHEYNELTRMEQEEVALKRTHTSKHKKGPR